MLECSGTLWNNLETVEAVLTPPTCEGFAMDYMPRIKLGDAECTIANRTYPCPRKYGEAFDKSTLRVRKDQTFIFLCIYPKG